MAPPLVARLTAVFCAALSLAVPVKAAEVRVLSTLSFQRVLEEAAPAFTQASGHQVRADFGGTTPMARRVRDGEMADVYLGTRQAISTLLEAGKVWPESVADVARSHVGFAVRTGAPRPDVSTAEALKRALLEARAITFPDPAGGSPSANHLIRITAQLGITDEVQQRARRPAGGGASGPILLAAGEVDLAFQQHSELLLVPGVELLGSLPQEFQLITVMTAAVPTSAREPEAGQALISYLQQPAAAEVLRRWGLEPLMIATQ